MLEKFRGRAVTAQQLDHGRRICSIIAALIFACAGLAVAASVEISLGLKFVDLAHLRWQPVAIAALANAAVILGVSAALESLFWIWRELSLKDTVRDWAPDPADANVPGVRVAHLSDLHIVGERYGHRMEAGTDGPRGNRVIRTALRKLAAIDGASPVDRVLMTGDITDAGTRAEWAEFIDLLRGCPALRGRLCLVPGNHDVNIIDRANPGRLDLPLSPGQSLRQLRVVMALDTLSGDRLHLVERGSGALGPTFSDFLRIGAARRNAPRTRRTRHTARQTRDDASMGGDVSVG